jgi:hypothetical protein
MVQSSHRNSYEIYENMRNLQNHRQSAPQEMLPFIDMAMQGLIRELRASAAMPDDDEEPAAPEEADNANES